MMSREAVEKRKGIVKPWLKRTCDLNTLSNGTESFGQLAGKLRDKNGDVDENHHRMM